METKVKVAKVSFADARFKSFDMNENYDLTIFLNSWDEKMLRVVFYHTIQFSFKLGDVTQQLYQILGNNSFFEEALNREYVKAPEDHPFKMFQIHDIDDFPYIEVVAERVEVIKE